MFCRGYKEHPGLESVHPGLSHHIHHTSDAGHVHLLVGVHRPGSSLHQHILHGRWMIWLNYFLHLIKVS